MRLGDLLGSGKEDLLKIGEKTDKAKRKEQAKERERQRQREIEHLRRQGKTIRFRRED